MMEAEQVAGDESSSSEFRDNSKIFVCRLAKRYLSTNTGYPYFSPEYVAARIDRPGTDRTDLEQYRSTHAPVKFAIRLLMMFSSCVSFLRVVSMPIILFNEMNFNNFSKNLEWRSDGYNQFSCIISYCSGSGVDAETLLERLGELPYFSICHPQLSNWSDVTQYLGTNGIMLATTSGLAVLLAGLVLPLLNKLRPTGNLCLMFLVAPRVTRRVLEDRAQELLAELERSYFNHNSTLITCRYRSKIDIRFDPQKAIDQRKLAPTRFYASSEEELVALRAPTAYASMAQHSKHCQQSLLRRPVKEFQLNEQQPQMSVQHLRYVLETELPDFDDKRLLNGELGHLINNLQLNLNLTAPGCSSSSLDQRGFARDCVTMLRSAWWRTRATETLWKLTILTLGNLVVQIFVVGFALYHIVNARRRVYEQVADDLHQMNCSLWITSGSEQIIDDALKELEPLNVDELEINLNLALSLFYVAQCIWPFICVNFFLLSYLLTNAELICWLYEIKLGLTMGVEFVRQILAKQQDHQRDDLGEFAQKFPPQTRAAHKVDDSEFSVHKADGKRFDMDILRTRAKELICVRLLVVSYKHPGERLEGTKSKLEAACATRKFVARAIDEHQMGLAAAVELLEKLYINFRIFAEHVDHYGAVMTVMLTFINIYIYGFVIIGVISLRLIKDHVLFPALLLTIGWVSANGLILVASNLHAKAKGLHALIWTLVAITSRCNNSRLRHMRSLWIKQVGALDRDGGLALKAFSMRITYIRIVQLVIGTGTLVVFALRL